MTLPALQHGQPTASADLAELYEREGPRLRAFVARLSGEPDAAEDLCHDAFLKALQSWSTRRADGNTLAWLYQIARHVVYDDLRRRARVVITPLCAASLAVDCTSSGTRDLAVMVAALPPRTRAVLLLFGAGYRIHEIAALAQMQRGAVRSLMHRGRAHLRAQTRVSGGC